MSAVATAGFETCSILLLLCFGKHPIIADNCDATGLRRFDATLANSALERLEGIQRGKRGAAFFRLDQMDKGVVKRSTSIGGKSARGFAQFIGPGRFYRSELAKFQWRS